MKKKLVSAYLIACLGVVGCGGTGNNTQNQNTQQDSIAQSTETQPTTTEEVVKDTDELDNGFSDTIFTEDVAAKVLKLLKIEASVDKNRKPEEYYKYYGNDNKNNDINILCFKKTDGSVLVSFEKFTEAEGAREYSANQFYLLQNDILTKTNNPFEGYTLDNFSDELGKLHFMINSDFVEDHQIVWDRFSKNVIAVSNINNRSVALRTEIDDLPGIFNLTKDWNGSEFVTSEKQKMPYIYDNHFGPIYCEGLFPDLSNLKEYKTSQKGDSIALTKNGEPIATFEIKNKRVKDFAVYSPQYEFWQGWGVGHSTKKLYEHFEKVKKDEEGNCYIPWFEKVRFYFNNSDLTNNDLNNPVFASKSKITKVKVIGKEYQKPTHNQMPTKIYVTNYKSLDSWDQTTSVYSLKYDDKQRITEVTLDDKPYYQITYSDNQVVVKEYDPMEYSEDDFSTYIYTTRNGKFAEFTYNDSEPSEVIAEKGFLKSYSENSGQYSWKDDNIASTDYDMEGLTLYYQYPTKDFSNYFDNLAVNVEYLIREGYLKIDATTLFADGDVVCRGESLPKKIIYDGSNVKAEITVYTNKDGDRITSIYTSERSPHNRLFNRTIKLEY